MYRVSWSERSIIRIEEICTFIELNSPKAAKKWVSDIFDKELLLRDNPMIGKIMPEEGNESVRQIIIGNYRLIYELHGKNIHILTVKNCRQL